MDFEELVRLLEGCDGQQVQIVVNPAGPLTAVFGGELWLDKEWMYVDAEEAEPLTEDDVAAVVGCRVENAKDAGSFRITKAIYVAADLQDERTLLITTVGGEVEIEAEAAVLGGYYAASS